MRLQNRSLTTLSRLLVGSQNLNSSSEGQMVKQVCDLEVVEQVVNGQNVQDAAVNASVKKQILKMELKNFWKPFIRRTSPSGRPP